MNGGVSGRRLAASLIVVSTLFTGCWAFAETVRISSWDMQSLAIPAGDELIKQAADTLRQLNPDVILLQGVQDWATGNQLAQALKPAQYNVALCSSFREPSTGELSKRQLAILSKQRPYFYWSESWHDPEGKQPARGGFAFVAVQSANRRLGFYCVDLSSGRFASNAVQQLLQHVQTVKRWEANSVQTVGVAGVFTASDPQKQAPNPVALLLENGFADTCFDLVQRAGISRAVSPAQPAAQATYLLAERSAFGIAPQELLVSGQAIISCDLELDPAKVAAAWPARAQKLERQSLARQVEEERMATKKGPVPGQRTPASLPKWWWLAAPVAACLLLVLLAFRRGRRQLALPGPRQPALLPGVEGNWNGTSSYTVVISSESITGSAENEPGAAQMPHPLVHLENTVPHAHSGASNWPPNILAADEPARSRLLADLGRWLKQAFVRRLVTDREQLLQAQEAAALKAKAVDERLSRIEQQIQQQTREYERRIEELTVELLAAKEENRELIRARIAQVKLEMAAVRAKALAKAQAARPD